MNWDAIGAVGEVVGAAAVVISIVYLGYQIRQNTRSTKLAVEQDIASQMTSFVIDVASSDIPDIYVRGSEDIGQLSDEEVAKFGFYVLGILRIFQQAYDQRLEGNLSDRSWASIESSFITQLQSPGIRAAWEIRRSTFKEEFRTYVDSISIDENVLSPWQAVKILIEGSNNQNSLEK